MERNKNISSLTGFSTTSAAPWEIGVWSEKYYVGYGEVLCITNCPQPEDIEGWKKIVEKYEEVYLDMKRNLEYFQKLDETKITYEHYNKQEKNWKEHIGRI